MIHAEIITELRTYSLQLHDFESLEAAYDYVERTLMSGGWAEFIGREQILCINVAENAVKAYRVWEENPPPGLYNYPAPMANLTEEREDGAPRAWSKFTKHLGLKLDLEGLVINKEGKTYRLITAINGQYPLDVMSREHVENLMRRDFPDSVPVVPPVTLTSAEASAYLMDAAEEGAALDDVFNRFDGERTARAAGEGIRLMHIRSKSDRDRVRQRSSDKQRRKGLLARLASRGIYPAIDPKRPPKLADLQRLIDEYDAGQVTLVMEDGALVPGVGCMNGCGCPGSCQKALEEEWRCIDG